MNHEQRIAPSPLDVMLKEYRDGERGMPTYDELMALLSVPGPLAIFQSTEQNEQLARDAQAIVDAEVAALASDAAAPEGQLLIGKLMDKLCFLPVLWGLNEPGALLRHSDVFRMLVDAGREQASAAAPQLVVDEWELPPLPVCYDLMPFKGYPVTSGICCYTAQQMVEYARAAISADPLHATVLKFIAGWDKAHRDEKYDELIFSALPCIEEMRDALLGEKADGGAVRPQDFGYAAIPVQASNPVEFDGIKTTPVQAQEPEDDFYTYACEELERGQEERAKRGVEIGCQGSLCDGIAWLFDRLKKLESAAPVQPAAVPDGAALVSAMCKAGQLNDHGSRVLLNGEEIGFDLPSLLAIVNLAAPAAQGDAKDAERYRYIRDTETIEAMVWEALDGDGSVNGEGELDRAGYAAGMDRAIDAAIAAKAAS